MIQVWIKPPLIIASIEPYSPVPKPIATPPYFNGFNRRTTVKGVDGAIFLGYLLPKALHLGRKGQRRRLVSTSKLG
jgi:hypothetical protein